MRIVVEVQRERKKRYAERIQIAVLCGDTSVRLNVVMVVSLKRFLSCVQWEFKGAEVAECRRHLRQRQLLKQSELLTLLEHFLLPCEHLRLVLLLLTDEQRAEFLASALVRHELCQECLECVFLFVGCK